jgi:hypothetical protein
MVPPAATATDRSAVGQPRLPYASVLVLTLMQVTLLIDN